MHLHGQDRFPGELAADWTCGHPGSIPPEQREIWPAVNLPVHPPGQAAVHVHVCYPACTATSVAYMVFGPKIMGV